MASNPFTKLFAKATPVRQAAPSTSYKAKGLAIPGNPSMAEAGTSQQAITREVVPVLSTPFQRVQEYAKMENDAAVNVSMRVAKTPILGAEFFMEPFSDNELDLEISEFIWANLAEGMSSPFLHSLQDILRFYEDGYSVLEKVYEKRNWAPRKIRSGANTKEHIMLKKLGVRPASTIKEIIYDKNGGPVSITQNVIAPDGNTSEKSIKIDQLMIFTHGRIGGDLTGKSLLRTAYPHWYYKNHMYKIDAVQKERHSLGVPKGKLLPGWTNKDREILRSLLRNIRANEEAFIIETPNVEVTFAELSGNLVNVLDSAVHHNGMILMNVLAQFLAMGTSSGSGGGRATAGTSSDIFMKSLKYVANMICQEINMYLIPELVVWNYPTNNFPKLNVRNIGETKDLQMWASGISNLFAQGAITPTVETEQWVRKGIDAPQFIGTWSDPNVAAANAANSNANGANGNGNNNGNSAADAKAAIDAAGGAGNAAGGNGNNGKGDVKGGSGFVGKSPSSAN